MILALATVVADDKQDEISRLIDDAGPVAGLFVLILAIVVFLLWSSMKRQLKRIDPSLPAGPDDLEQDADGQLTADAAARGEADAPDPDAGQTRT